MKLFANWKTLSLLSLSALMLSQSVLAEGRMIAMTEALLMESIVVTMMAHVIFHIVVMILSVAAQYPMIFAAPTIASIIGVTADYRPRHMANIGLMSMGIIF